MALTAEEQDVLAQALDDLSDEKDWSNEEDPEIDEPKSSAATPSGGANAKPATKAYIKVQKDAQALDIGASTFKPQSPSRSLHTPRSQQKADRYITDSESEEEDHEEAVEEEEAKARYPCGECLCFILFLILFTGMAIFSIGNGDLNYTQTGSFRKSLVEKEIFYGWNTDLPRTVTEKHFDDVSTIEDIYGYMRQILIPFLLSDPKQINGSTGYYVQNSHVLLGGIRLRQIRQRPLECVYDAWKDSDCLEEHDITRETVYFYNDRGDNVSYSYIDSSVLLDQRYRGKFDSYPGGGYVQDLPLDKNKSLEWIDTLQEYHWIDAATLFLSLDFNAYNPSVSLHTVVRLTWEMPTSGIFSNDEMKTWKFDRYYGEVSGFILFFIHVIFFFFVVIISGFMMVDIYRYYGDTYEARGRKEDTFWNSYRVMDILNLIIFYCLIALFLNNELYQKSLIDIYDFRAPFESFRRLQGLSLIEAYCFAFGGFLLWLKLFKYLSFHPKFKFLFFMMQRGLQDIIMFILILFVFYLAFAISGFMIFSSDVAEYRTYGYSFISMNLFMLTEMNYADLMASSRIFGSFYYFAWLIWMTFILINVFIAILIDSYAKTQVEIELNSSNAVYFNVFEKGREYVKRLKFAQMMSRFDAIDEDGDEEVDVHEIAKALRLPLEEARKVIEAYDKDGDGVLDRNEFEKLKQKMIREKMEEPTEYLIMQKELTDQNLTEQMSEIKFLMNEMLKIDPVGKRVLKQQKGHQRKQTLENIASAKRKSTKASTKPSVKTVNENA